MQMPISNSFHKMPTNLTFKKFIPGIAWFFLVGILVFMPGSDLPKIKWLGIPHFDKIVHAGLFGGIVFFFCMPYFSSFISSGKKYVIYLFISMLTVFWGLAVEFIQKYFVSGRSFDWFDWLADSVGIGVAFFISIYLTGKRK